MTEIRLCSTDRLPKPGLGTAFVVDAPLAKGAPAMYASTLPPGKRRLAVFNTRDGLKVFDDFCPHQHAPLASGALTGMTLTCNWHFWQFDLKNGHCLLAGDWGSLRLYKTRIAGNDVFVELEE